MSKPDIAPALQLIRQRMNQAAMPALVLTQFSRQVEALAAGATGLIAESQIQPVTEIDQLDNLPDDPTAAATAMHHCVVIKLNGGLGTSMGLNQAKSLLPARADQTFLDLIVQQVLHQRQQFNAPLPLLLMNSFRTEADSLAFLARYPELHAGQADLPLSFLQHKVPRLLADTLQPVEWPHDPDREWCPPGHGDLYTALMTTGLLDRLLAAGIRYAFVSNSDNLGASVDPRILALMASESIPFLMEVTERTPADRKGGHLALGTNGRLRLRESAQCPVDDLPAFQDIQRHRFFNTNNLWLNLVMLRQRLDQTQSLLDLPLIRNVKRVVPEDADTPEVIQLETAMGAAIECFDGARALAVSRQRFIPVKTTNDLLALWSDRYRINDDGRLLALNEQPIRIELDPRYFGPIEAFRQRFPHGAPSLRHAEELIVRGDVVFGRDISIRGKALVENTGADTALHIPDRSQLS